MDIHRILKVRYVEAKFQERYGSIVADVDGSIAAYRFLFDQHFADLCNFLLIYLNSKELSEEIALEIFTHIWEKREDLIIKATFNLSFLLRPKTKPPAITS